MSIERIGAEAVAAKGWLAAHKWLLLRRVSQISILALFLLGPLAGVWIVKGNLTFSYTLDVLPLTDPYILLQSLLTRHLPEMKAFVGAAIVLSPGATMTEEELLSRLGQHLAKFKIPERVWFLNESLPRNANGKFVKRDLKAQLLGA